MITPGPAEIDPGAAPGGVVMHAYRVPDAALVNTVRLTIGEDLKLMATECDDANLTDEDVGVVMVFYDGDTGQRLWTQPALFV